MYFEKRSSKKATKGYTWCVIVTYKDADGVSQRYTKSGFNTKAEANDHGLEFERHLSMSGGQKPSDLTFNQVFEEYMEIEGEHKYAPTTSKYYWSTYHKHVEKSSIGNQKISSLNFREVQKYFNTLASRTKAINKNVKKVFCVTFKYALKNGYIFHNPMPDVNVYGQDNSREKFVYTKEQIDSLVESLCTTSRGRRPNFTSYSMCIFIYLGYYLGTRRSEALALTKADVDFENGYVNLNKRLEYQGLTRDKFYVTDKMKTKGSKAKIPLCKPLAEILKQWFEYNPYELICCTGDGKFISPYDLDFVCKSHAEKLSFEFRTHLLRHTFITNLSKNENDPKIVSLLARHSDVHTTLQIYRHVSNTEQVEAVNRTFNG